MFDHNVVVVIISISYSFSVMIFNDHFPTSGSMYMMRPYVKIVLREDNVA